LNNTSCASHKLSTCRTGRWLSAVFFSFNSSFGTSSSSSIQYC